MNFLGYITLCDPLPTPSGHGGGRHGSQSAYVEHFLSFQDNQEWSFQETGFLQPDVKRAPSQPESGALVNMIKSERPKTSQKYLQQERKKNESQERGSEFLLYFDLPGKVSGYRRRWRNAITTNHY